MREFKTIFLRQFKCNLPDLFQGLRNDQIVAQKSTLGRARSTRVASFPPRISGPHSQVGLGLLIYSRISWNSNEWRRVVATELIRERTLHYSALSICARCNLSL